MSNTNYPKDIEETERAKAIRHNYDDLFWRQPNVHAVGVGFLIDQEGRRTDQIGVLVSVTEIAPTDQVLPEDRLPDYLDGVPVQILEEAIHQSWSEQILRHRPLMSGIRVTAPAIGSGTNVGTLTGWATRNSDNTKVLVTALHLVTGVDRLHLVSEDEELYQIETTIPAEKVGDILGWVEISDVPGALNAADAAIFRPAGVVQATFEPHIHSTGHIHNSSNFAGLILAGTVDPKPGMDLKYLSPYYGARDVVVERVGDTRSIGDYSYQDVVRLDLGSNLGGLGDSGVACLYQVGADKYKMVCIVGAGSETGDKASAFKASVVESELGITFGAPVPMASIQEVADTRNKLGEVLRRLTVPIKTLPNSNTPASPIETGMSRCSLTYAPPITFVREGTWAKGTWQSTGLGGVGYYPVLLNRCKRRR